MDHHLTVVRDFGAHRKGDHIEDEDEIRRILGGEHRKHVVKVAADKGPAEPAAPTNPVAPEPGDD